MRDAIIALDMGTSSTRAIAYDTDGRILARHQVPHPVAAPSPGAAVHDPDQLLLAAELCVRSVAHLLSERILGVCLSCALHGILALDARDQPLTPCYTWADSRAAPWAQTLRHSDTGTALYQRTGTPIHAMSPLVKIMWLRAQAPAQFEKAARFVSLKEYLLIKWLRQPLVDLSVASATGLFNLRARDWDDEALAMAGIQRSQLSTPASPRQIIPLTDAALARKLGLRDGTPFVLGAGDGPLSNLGLQATRAHQVAITLGTSGALRRMTTSPDLDPEGRLFCYLLDETHYVVGGAVNNVGLALNWALSTLVRQIAPGRAPEDQDFAAFTQAVRQIPAGAEGLLFHPYLAGERSPWWQASLHASFFNLGLHHQQAHLLRAVLDGIVLAINTVFQQLQTAAGRRLAVHAAGGFLRCSPCAQALTDALGQTLLIATDHESSARGAALLGFQALGQPPDPATGAWAAWQSLDPGPESAAYATLQPVFERLAGTFAPLYEGLASLPRSLQGMSAP